MISRQFILCIPGGGDSIISGFIGRALSGLGRALVGLGKALVGLIIVAGVIAFISTIASSLIHFAPIMIILGLIAAAGSSMSYDPKLVILVDDGKGGTVHGMGFRVHLVRLIYSFE